MVSKVVEGAIIAGAVGGAVGILAGFALKWAADRVKTESRCVSCRTQYSVLPHDAPPANVF